MCQFVIIAELEIGITLLAAHEEIMVYRSPSSSPVPVLIELFFYYYHLRHYCVLVCSICFALTHL